MLVAQVLHPPRRRFRAGHFRGQQWKYWRNGTALSALHSQPVAALCATRFLIIGVQKPRIKRLQQTLEVRQFEITPAPGLLAQGRKKYERLMKAFIQQQAPPIQPITPGLLMQPLVSA